MRRIRACTSILALIAALASPAQGAGLPAGLAYWSSLTAATADEIYPSGFETQVTLTLTDYIAWCKVTIDRGDPQISTFPIYEIVRKFDQGRVVPLHGETAAAGVFYWRYWEGTDAAGAGMDFNPDATVTMSGDKAVLACCPISGAGQSTTCP